MPGQPARSADVVEPNRLSSFTGKAPGQLPERETLIGSNRSQSDRFQRSKIRTAWPFHTRLPVAHERIEMNTWIEVRDIYVLQGRDCLTLAITPHGRVVSPGDLFENERGARVEVVGIEFFEPHQPDHGGICVQPADADI